MTNNNMIIKELEDGDMLTVQHRIETLIRILNCCRNQYYNEDESILTDSQYDKYFDELKELEESSQFKLTNSPTQSVGYEVIDKFEKFTHTKPMLSLDKTKDIDDIIKFNHKDLVGMLKLDGISCSITINDGEIESIATRGDGHIGDDITHNKNAIRNIPTDIAMMGKCVILGELIVAKSDFDEFNSNLKEGEKPFKLQRSMASGSARQLDASICAQRNVQFVAYGIHPIDVKSNKFEGTKGEDLRILDTMGFKIVPTILMNENSDVELISENINTLKDIAEDNGYPIDGIVFTYNDNQYAESLGVTTHHPLHSIAYKFEDEENTTQFRGVELNVTRNGMVSLTGLFDPIDINGSEISRASLHNLDIFESLQLGIGDNIQLIKANDIIPQITGNETKSNTYKLPNNCPYCNSELIIKTPKDARFLYCSNDKCGGKNIAQIVHFVSKSAMNIEGLSEATIEKFVDEGIIANFTDIFDKSIWIENKDNILKLEGFGIKSFENIVSAIESSRNTTLDKFIYALGIPLIGRTASKTIAKRCGYKVAEFVQLISNEFAWENLPDFGITMSESINEYFDDPQNYVRMLKISRSLNFSSGDIISSKLKDLSIVVTGTLPTLGREQVKKMIEINGGLFKTSVSKKTDYLVAGEDCGSKLDKAKELKIKIIGEKELLEMLE